MNLFNQRKECCEFFNQAIIEQLKHVTDAISEFQKFDESSSIQWKSVELSYDECGPDTLTIVGEIFDLEGADTVTSLYGQIPLGLVLCNDKQTIIDYFVEQDILRDFNERANVDHDERLH